MELKITNEIIDIRETIFEGTPEQGFECDILLPDYCPEIRRILKCHVKPKVSQCYQNADKVNIDGFIFVKVYYLCDENRIHSFDSKVPFSKVVEIREGVDGISVSVGAKSNYVNCRAVNQRRLDVRGAITIITKITGKTSQNVVCDAVGDGIQLKKSTINTSSLCAEASTQFSVQEEESVNTSVNAILRSEAVVMITDVKVIPNKAIMKGELKVTTTYAEGEDGKLNVVSHLFPISRIMDIDRLNSESLLEVSADAVSVDVVAKQDENGESKKLLFDVKVNIFAKVFENKDVVIATDAYSTGFESNYSAKTITTNRALCVIDETFTHREQIEVQNLTADRLIDLCCCPTITSSRVESNKLLVDIPMETHAFFELEDGSVEFFEKQFTVPFEYALSQEVGSFSFTPCVNILYCDYTFSSPNKLEIKLEVKIVGTLITQQSENCICEINLDYTTAKKAEDTPALTIYYCEEGEEVWNIAKRYNTCADSIMQENDLECEQINTARVILIPSLD